MRAVPQTFMALQRLATTSVSDKTARTEFYGFLPIG